MLAGGGVLPARCNPSDMRSADPHFCRALAGEAAQRQGIYVHITYTYIHVYIHVCTFIYIKYINIFVLINLDLILTLCFTL